MDQPEPDYPAAHSMDTEWYAVDRDGHVGLFESGEAGAVPEGAHTENETPREDLARHLPPSPYRLLDWLGDDGQEHHVDLTPRRSGGKEGLGKTMMFLASTDPIREEIDAIPSEREEAGEGSAVLFHDLPVELAWRLHEAGQCLGCFAWPDEGRGWGFHEDAPRRIGLFHFRHDGKAENWISGRYLRKHDRGPDRPIKIDDLPPDLREAIGRVRFADLSFADDEGIQPIPRFACSSWQSAYLDPDGVTIRPIPGSEEDFDPDAWSRIPGFRVVLPNLGPPPAEPGG